jgi:hypothetical protein
LSSAVVVPPAPPSASELRARLAASALAQIRGHAISLAAPGEIARHIAVGKGFVLQLRDSSAELFGSTDGKAIASVNLDRPRAALALLAGSVLVVAGNTAYRFDPGEKRPHPLASVVLLPGALLVPSRESMERVWLFTPTLARAERYDLVADAGVGPALIRTFPDCNGGVITMMSGGDLLCAARDKLVRISATGRVAILSVPAEVGAVWRLAAADHIDRVWIATERGELLLVELSSRARIVRSLGTHVSPVDFAADSKRLALLEVVEQANEARHFRLRVLKTDGRELFSKKLAAAAPSASRDWEAEVLRDRELVLGGKPERVVVGGPDSVQVFDADTGDELFAR